LKVALHLFNHQVCGGGETGLKMADFQNVLDSTILDRVVDLAKQST
jgi:hypothetical protein